MKRTSRRGVGGSAILDPLLDNEEAQRTASLKKKDRSADQESRREKIVQQREATKERYYQIRVK